MHSTLFINKRRKIERLKVLLFFLKVLVFRNEVRNLANDHPLNYQEVLFTRFLFKKPAKKDLKMKSDIVILRATEMEYLLLIDYSSLREVREI